MYCTNCGAEIDENDASCPYCGYLNPYGAERKYMKELEVIRVKTDKLDDHPENYVKAEVKKKGRKAGFIFLVVLAVIGGLVGFFFGLGYILDHNLIGDNAREEMEFRDKYIPELNQMLEEGRDEEAYNYMMGTLYKEKGSDYLWNWEHYEYLTTYGSLVYVRRINEKALTEGLDKREFVSAGQDVLTGAKEELYTYGRKIPDSDLEKIEAMHEEEMLFLTETIGMTEEEIDEIYESAMEDDWVSYTKLEEALSKYWDKVPNELKEGGKS